MLSFLTNDLPKAIAYWLCIRWVYLLAKRWQ